MDLSSAAATAAPSKLSFNGSLLSDTLDWSRFGAFEGVGEGINTIGGRTTLDGEQVFVKFTDEAQCCAAAFADSFMSVLDLPSVGTHVVRTRVPAQGASVPYAKTAGALKHYKAGARPWALVSRWLDLPTVTSHVASAHGMDVSKISLRTQKDTILARLNTTTDRAFLNCFAVSLAARMALGAGDMGPGNFLYDAANNRIYCLDMGSALGPKMDPGTHKPLLQANLLPQVFKERLIEINAENGVASLLQRVLASQTLRVQCTALLARYPKFMRQATQLASHYVLPNLQCVLSDYRKLMLSAGRGTTSHGFFQRALQARGGSTVNEDDDDEPEAIDSDSDSDSSSSSSVVIVSSGSKRSTSMDRDLREAHAVDALHAHKRVLRVTIEDEDPISD